MTTTQADWRRWATLLALAAAERPLTTENVVADIRHLGWATVLPISGQWDAAHRALTALEKGSMVERYQTTKTSRWSLTSIGQDFVATSLTGNPNITPEKAAA
jgi:hypothetical protein